jgi:murein DD-endopeptidase MepM/ murein hydrolase activator NlpD
LQNTPVVVRRLLARLRPSRVRRSRRALSAPATIQHAGAHRVSPVRLGRVGRLTSSWRPPAADQLWVGIRRVIAWLGGLDRLLPIGVAVLVLASSIVNVAPAIGSGAMGATGSGATGNTAGAGSAPRLAVGGIDAHDGELDPSDVAPAAVAGTSSYREARAAGEGAPRVSLDATAVADIEAAKRLEAKQPTGPYLADGTLLMPVAVHTTVADGSAKLRTYAVRQSDTLTGIASRFGISMMTIWWANDLTSKDALHIGQKLVIPPVSGLVVRVKPGDTLDSVAMATGGSADQIVTYNGLTDGNLVIGQTLVIPGAHGDAIATPAPTKAPTPSRTNGAGSAVSPPQQYTGGRLAWPVPGGYISQYFHSSHPALDIAADMGSPILAAADATVILAGWRDNGGGYQVWLSHGSNLNTAYYHMAAVTVGAGQSVARGQQIGRIGMSGWATGPQCHFEVWIGAIDYGTRVNPLNYL